MQGREALATFLKGAAMGTADMVPGVSGGTIAMIAGIYDRLVAAIASLGPRPLRHLLAVHRPEGRAAIAEAWTRMDLTFLLALGAGMASAVVGMSQVIPVAYERIPGLTSAFFAGLIAASVVLIGRSVPWTRLRVGLAVVAAAVATAVAVVSGTSTDPSLVLVFVAGAVAISAMVLPGLSGALLLIVLGLYQYMTSQLDALLEAVVHVATGGASSTLVESGTVVLTFLSGAVIGLLTVARAVDYALERNRATTIAGLVGLMAGGLYQPATKVAANTAPDAVGVASVAAAAALGAGVVAGFARATGDLEYVEADEVPSRTRPEERGIGESDHLFNR